MSLFHSRAPPLVLPPDDLSIPQFFLADRKLHSTRPDRPPHVPCLIDEESGRPIFLAELQDRTRALARALRGVWNIAPGDVVSLYIPNHVEYPVIIWALHLLGVVIAAHSPALTVEELQHQLHIAQPVLLIAHAENVPVALKASKQAHVAQGRIALLDGPEDSPYTSIRHLIANSSVHAPAHEYRLQPGEAKTRVAFMCFSSGTTGVPKAVCISHYNVICNVVQNATYNRINEAYTTRDLQRFRPGDVCAGVLPLYHIYGLVVNLHFMLYSGMTLVLSKKFVYENFLRSIERYHISHLMIVPPMAVLFCKHPATPKFNLSSVRYCMIAAAPVSAELTEQLLRVFPNVQLGQGYGMTETCATVSMFPVSQHVGTPGSAGQLVSGTVAKVVKPDGSHAGPGEPGELYVKGPQMALGYYGNDEATREAFIDGWVRTGDEVVIQEDGDIYVTDRIKELIKVKGNQVAPSELEGHLLHHPDVADAAVIGIPDDYAGEAPLAYVVLKPSVAAEVARDPTRAPAVKRLLFQHVAAVTSKYKWLTGGVEFVDVIPKNASGKILRRVLRERSKGMKPIRAAL
ncbi:phenylacetyl-CoA ligase [Trametes gibbosa]|nr:phenylacetyl-CoA ligase [Trametes gibbosa]